MSSATREVKFDTKSAPALFIFLAIGIFLIGYGGERISTNENQGFREALQWVVVVAGIFWILAAVAGAVDRLKNLRS